MSVSTLIGLVASFALCAIAIVASTDDVRLFFSLPSLVMVLGGTMACAFAGYQARYVWRAFGELGRVMLSQRSVRRELPVEIGKVIRWGYLAKSKGLQALEDEIKKRPEPEPYLVYGIDLVLSGYEPEAIRAMLDNAAESTHQRNTVPAMILRSMAATSPAFGMIGTLVGLAIMMQTVGGDPSALGPGFAVALMTTLYGLLLARLVFLPAASRLEQRAAIERFRNHVAAEGLVLIAERRNPREIKDRMNSFLDPELHVSIDARLTAPAKPAPAAKPATPTRPAAAPAKETARA